MATDEPKDPGPAPPQPTSADPQMAEILRLVAELAAGKPLLSEMTPAEARAAFETDFSQVWNADKPIRPIGVDRALPGPLGAIPVRLFDPGVAHPAPCLVYLHGGGWVLGNRDSHDGLCRRLADATGAIVVSVDYRLAPEHRFPAPLNDCVAAVRWLRNHGAEWGIDGRRMALAGDSAGGNLSLATCLVLRDAGEPVPSGAALLYGAFDADPTTTSHRKFGDGSYLLSTADMVWYWGHYAPQPTHRSDPLAAPLHADLSGLPEMFVAAAELDPLCDDSVRLAARLAESGQPFTYRCWAGMAHGCLHMTRMLDAAHRHIGETAQFLSRVLAT